MNDQGAYFTVISVFLKQKREGKPLTITGDGEQTRDFIHARDVVNANILAMQNENLGNGEAINIGSGKRYSVNYIASFIGGEKIYLPARIEPRDTEADIKKASALLNWVPQVEFEIGLKELAENNGN
jgi:nucleoside-diphosphate-sugar epimerase